LNGFSEEFIAFLATSLLVYFLSSRAHAVGLLDKPSGRKVHETDTPTVGGIAIFGGFLLALYFSSLIDVYLVGFVVPASLLVGVGALDDVVNMSPRSRFTVQILAGLLMTVAGGVVVAQLGALLVPGTVITTGVLAIPFTIICLVGLVNAFNMMDGIDGLAGSLTLIAFLGLGTVAYIGGQLSMVEGLSFLCFSLLAFLAFNVRHLWRKQADIFLGDCGSTFLGFSVLWFSVSLSQGEHAVMTPVTPLWFVVLPLFDMTTVMIRRVRSKRHPFEADREHLHHLFLAIGFSVAQTVLILTAVASVLALAGIAGLYLGVPENAMLALYLGLFAGYYYLVMHSWEKMRFLGRQICGGVEQEHCIADGVRPDNSAVGVVTPLMGSSRVNTNAKTVFINRFFWPDHSATSQLLTDLAFTLAVHGKRVSVITSRQRYDEPLAQLPSSETASGVIIERVWTSRYGRHGLPGRAFDYLTFYLSALWQMWRTVSKDDVVVAMTDPPLICIPAALVASMRGAKLVIWHQDLFPEVASVLGVKGMRGSFAEILLRLRNIPVRRASLNVVLSRNMAQRLIDEGNPGENIRIIPNWADGSAIYPTEPDENPLRAAWGLRERFVVGYSGNVGRVHEFVTLLEAAEQLREEPRIVFLFIGDGYYRAWIEREAKERGLNNIMFRPYQPRERLIDSLGVPDLHIISLRQDMEGLVFPSKLYGILAAGRPSLFIGAEQGDVSRILRTEQCGLVAGEGDTRGVVEGIRQLQRDPALKHAMGGRARALFERHYDIENGLLSWCHVFSPLYAETESCKAFESKNEWAEVRREA
jgi:colanic acid biosynthesis glycosyl transferase WcaI